jgi:hypothetical protein
MYFDTAASTDLDELTALNHHYIQSVQQGDVERSEAILADDFIASNPDGSLVDKQQFLAQTARPVSEHVATPNTSRFAAAGLGPPGPDILVGMRIVSVALQRLPSGRSGDLAS